MFGKLWLPFLFGDNFFKPILTRSPLSTSEDQDTFPWRSSDKLQRRSIFLDHLTCEGHKFYRVGEVLWARPNRNCLPPEEHTKNTNGSARGACLRCEPLGTTRQAAGKDTDPRCTPYYTEVRTELGTFTQILKAGDGAPGPANSSAASISDTKSKKDNPTNCPKWKRYLNNGDRKTGRTDSRHSYGSSTHTHSTYTHSMTSNGLGHMLRIECCVEIHRFYR